MKNQDKILVPSIIKAQEDERLRISREIHDGPAQMMANIVYHAEICERWIDKDKDGKFVGYRKIKTR